MISPRVLVVPALATALLPAAPARAEDWRFVCPPPGAPDEHPPLRALVLSGERPEDVVEKVAYRGTRRRYAQVRYGSPNSVRVTVVLDEAAPGDVDLYVDADRDRRIEAEDRVAPDGRTWRMPLDVATVTGEATTYERRAAVFRLGATGLILGYAAAGYLEGAVRLDGPPRAARRVDGDGDGALADAADLLAIDLDGDGRFDPASEQFPFAPVLAIGGRRYAARSDVLGHRLALEPIEGTGAVVLKAPGAGRVVELSATLVGRDGSAVALRGLGASAEVPAGEYRLGAATVGLEDPSGGPRWTFVFADIVRLREPSWHRVEAGGTVALDPLGPLTLHPTLDPSALSPRAGGDLDVRPMLSTGEGLGIVACIRGTAASPGAGPAATLTLEADDGRRLASARSGFS